LNDVRAVRILATGILEMHPVESESTLPKLGVLQRYSAHKVCKNLAIRTQSHFTNLNKRRTHQILHCKVRSHCRWIFTVSRNVSNKNSSYKLNGIHNSPETNILSFLSKLIYLSPKILIHTTKYKVYYKNRKWCLQGSERTISLH
jgi:hypothetical protein